MSTETKLSELKDTEIVKKKKTVSYSQIMMYHTCPHKWYLSYIKKLSKYEENIHLLFGSAMHIVLQLYLYVVYNGTIAEADKMDLEKILLDELKKEFSRAKQNSGINPATKEQLMEFYYDGVEILRWFKKHKSDYFGKKGYDLIGYEIPLDVPINENINFLGYIDIVLRDNLSNKILIKDFKTSTQGWNQYQKKDETKIQQMVLYKKMYSLKYDVPIDNIEIEYIILKRKLYENVDYPQKRVQKFSPPSGNVTINKVMKNLNDFIDNCFTKDGEYIDKQYYKNASDKVCRFCEFKDKNDLCDKLN